MRLTSTVLRPVALALLLASGTLASSAALAADNAATVTQQKTRIIVLTDIGNEPDDSQSLVRFLVYSNQFDVEGLVATTSTWLRDKVNPQMIEARLDAYAQALPNLQQHAAGYPSVEALRAVVRSGRAAYGMQGVGQGKSTDASRLIIAAVDKQDTRPLWINVWGGGVDLAQALYDVQTSRSAAEVATFVSKIRVYAISDQDNTGSWIRRNFPQLRWITSIHAWNDYFLSTWLGISSATATGGDMSEVNNDWLAKNIRNKGPLGAAYPPIMYTMEGDTPSFLYLLQNGLSDSEHPEYGSWGGRYAAVYPDSDEGLRVSTSDTVMGVDGQSHRTAPATIWRWRNAFQNDFAARMDWAVSASKQQANHNPDLVLNGKPGKGIVAWQVRAGEKVTLSAKGSHDVDGNKLDYRWWQYKEPTATAMQIHFGPELKLNQDAGESTSFTAPEVKAPTPFHIILEVRDDGTPALTSYRRAIVTVLPAKP